MSNLTQQRVKPNTCALVPRRVDLEFISKLDESLGHFGVLSTQSSDVSNSVTEEANDPRPISSSLTTSNSFSPALRAAAAASLLKPTTSSLLSSRCLSELQISRNESLGISSTVARAALKAASQLYNSQQRWRIRRPACTRYKAEG